MKSTRLSKLLSIQHPIIQAGMAWVSNAELAAAVSNAGGLGLITPNAGLPADGDVLENFYTQLRKLRALTNKPYGVSLFLDDPQLDTLINIAIEQSVPVAVTAGGSPNPDTGHMKDAGITVFHVVASVLQARSAEARGADAVITEGYEAGSRLSTDKLTTLALVPQVVDSIEIPVVAAGGIVDGRGLAAALSLGAAGVQVGTRFLATHECLAHPNVKDAIINAIDTSTTVVNFNSHHARVLRNRTTTALEASGNMEELAALISEEKVRTAMLEGKVEEGIAFCGAGAGLITEIMSATDVVKSMVRDADSMLTKVR